MRTLLKIALLFIGLEVLPSFTSVLPGDSSKTILLIPYQPLMHISDADADIAEQSKINVRQVRVVMRNALIERLTFALRDNFYVRQLTEIGTAKEKDDLRNFYDSESFYLSSRDTSMRNTATVSSDSENPYFGIFKKSSSPDYASSYMSVSLGKPILFRELSSEYKAGYFLVLTQFEIKTHYHECIDIPNHVFRREFLVHFSVFDAEGKQTGGTAVSYDAGSDMDSINKITGNIFPELAVKICRYVSAATQ